MKAILSLFVFILATQICSAFEVLKIKNSKVLLKLQNETVQDNESLQVIDQAGSIVATLQIQKNKNNQAIAEIKTGSLLEKNKYQFVPKKNEKQKSAKAIQKISLAVSANNNNVQVNLTSSSTVSMTGSSYGLILKYDRPFFKDISLQLGSAIHQLKAEGSSSTVGICPNSLCQVELMNLDLSALVMLNPFNFSLINNNISTWLGAGVAVTYPVSKSSNIIDVSTIGLSQKVLLSAGLNWNIRTNQFIPFRIEYGFAINKTTVSMNQMMAEVGYGFEF